MVLWSFRKWQCPVSGEGGEFAGDKLAWKRLLGLQPSRSNSSSDTAHSRQFRILTHANSRSSFALVFPSY